MMEGYTEEILCDVSKEAKAYGLGFTDCPEMISEDLARKVYWRAMVYRIELDAGDGAGDEDIIEYPAQSGLLRSDLLVPSPGHGSGIGGGRYKVIPVTAKHNVAADLGRELFGTKMYSHAHDKCKRVVFPEMGLTPLESPLILKGSDPDTPDVLLPYGLDFTLGNAIENSKNAFTSVLASFEVVRHDFQMEKGQKIGISVWRSDARINIEGTPGKLSPADEAKYYGPPNFPIIQTGSVTELYGNGAAFGHSINTYQGCSGAIIFLLDKDQPPESVEAGDYGKAIGIHAAGYSPNNLGMAIFGEFHRRTNPSLATLD